MRLPILPYLCLASFTLLLGACNTTNNSPSKSAEGLSGTPWRVAYIEVTQGKRTGEQMGNPTYLFTESGYRIKRYETPPHADSVSYKVTGNTISYPGSKLPDVTILHLSEDSLALESQNSARVLWSLYR